MIVIETERMVLRRMCIDDSGFMLALLNSPTWLRFIGDRQVKTIADAQAYILKGPVDMYARLGFGFYVVEMKNPVGPIGVCGLAKRDYLDDVDIGFALLPDYAGRGLAHEAAGAVLDYAKTSLGLKRIVATTHPDNLDSAKLLMRLGLQFERMIKHPEADRELKLFAMDLPAIAASI